jgi:hypothetical protein
MAGQVAKMFANVGRVTGLWRSTALSDDVRDGTMRPNQEHNTRTTGDNRQIVTVMRWRRLRELFFVWRVWCRRSLRDAPAVH